MSDTLCRTCLCWQPQGFSLMEYCKDEGLHLYEIIMSFCQVQIKFNDNFPTDVCNSCLEDIKKAYSFKIKCERSENILKQKSSTLDQNDESKNFVHTTTFDDSVEQLHSPINEIIKLENAEYAVYDDDNHENEDESEYKNRQTYDLFNSKVRESIKKESENVIRFKKTFSRKKSKMKYTKSSYDDKSLKNCPHCGIQTKTSYQFKIHMSVHTGEKPFACDLCNYKCATSSALNIHKLIHTSEKPYSCTYCEYKCSNPSNLKRHIRIHTKDKPYACNMCSFRCVQSSYLKEHKKKHTGEKPYLCDQCHYTCRTPSALKTHKTHKHSSEKRFCCDECGFKCKTKNILIAHLKKHTGVKNFSCELCPYRAYHLVSLANHKMMVHTDERPFSCDMCAYKCVSLTYLKVHQKQHFTVKKFSCDECDYACHTRFKLKRHKLTHTGEKPYHCKMCDFRCSSSSSLLRHTKRKHLNKPLEIQ